MSTKRLQTIAQNTVAIMTTVQERRAEWYKTIIEVDLCTAVLALLDGQAPSLPGDHPYAAALAQIQAGIAAGGVT